MRRTLALAVCLSGLAVAPVGAVPLLLASGTLGGTSDLSGLTGTLENGLAANVLGGLGSGLAYAGAGTFLAIPDRGPNATAYNSAVDDTSSYISRFHTLTFSLTPNAGGGLPYTLTPTLRSTTLLSSPTALTYGTGAGLGNKIDGTTPIGSGAPAENAAGKYYFSGRSDNYGPGNSGVATNGRFDPEGVRVSADGRSVFISDEYGPYVRQFDRATGSLIKTFALPGNLNVATLSPRGDVEIAGNSSGRVANKGMEGLALTPDGKTLVGVMQAPLAQDAAITATKKLLRLVTIDIATGATKEYGYLLTGGSGVSEIVAVSNTRFLLDERDGKGLGDGTTAKVKQLFRIDLTGAADITGLGGAAAVAAAVPKSAAVVDLVALLGANGVTADQVPAKIEGLAFGADTTVVANGVPTVLHTLYVANDNDFVPGVSGPNTYYALGLTDADLGAVFQAQALAQAVPEPGTLAIVGAGLLGRRRRE